MFKKLFSKVDEFIEKFNEITNLEQFAIDVLHLIEDVFSKDKNLNEKVFDEIMNKPGLWKSIGAKLKKALKDKEEFLKQLLYICAMMNEFERRYRARQMTNKKEKEIEKIIEKYTTRIAEISSNIELPQEYRNEEIKKLRANMEKEIKELDFQHER